VGARVRAKDAVGRYGEDVAVRHLQDAGLTVVARNWRCRAGELDVVAVEGGVLVFCEIKTRSSDRFGSPAEAVGPRKARRIRGLAQQWLAESGGWPGDLRFDVVSVLRQPRGAARVEHLRGAF
jgi:putative endonuclease